MRAWLLNPYGPIPGEGWRDYRFTLVGNTLAARGHTVIWWTAAFAHQTKEFRSRDRRSIPVNEGFTIELVPVPSYSRNIGFARLWFEWVFSRWLIAHARWAVPPDVIIAADPPQFCGGAGRRLAREFSVPLIIDCLDLWPELFATSASAAVRPLVRIASLPLLLIRRRNVRAAEMVIAVAETYRRALTASVPARGSLTIPIGVDVQSIASRRPRDTRNCVVLYAGSLGEGYDLETILRAAAQLHDSSIEFVIAGRGPAQERLRQHIARSGLTNVHFLGSVNPAELSGLYANADLALAPYAAGSTVALPVKLFDYLAAGLPVITSLEGEARQLITGSNAGLEYRAGDAGDLAAVIRSLAGDPDRRARMSVAARAAASQFDSRVLYERYATVVEDVVASARS